MSYKKCIFVKSLMRCGLLAPLVGGIINAILYKPGHTYAYLGVEVFFTTLITSFVCALIFFKSTTKAKAGRLPQITCDLKKHFIYRRFSGHMLHTCTVIAIISTVYFAILPAILLIIVGRGLPVSRPIWVCVKMFTGIIYVTFTVYHITVYRAAVQQNIR